MRKRRETCTDFRSRMVLPTGFKNLACWVRSPGRAGPWAVAAALAKIRWLHARQGASDPGKPTATIHAHVHAHLCTHGPLQQAVHRLEVSSSLCILLTYFLAFILSEGPLA